MYYEVYVERLFLFYLYTNCCVLKITEEIIGMRLGIVRLMAAVGIGSAIQMAVFLPLPIHWFIQLLAVILLSSGVMIITSFGFRTMRQFLILLVAFMLSGALLQGISGRINYSGKGAYILYFTTFALLTFLIRRVFRKVRLMRKKRVPVSLHTGTKTVTVAALCDSGNLLKDQNTGKGICVMESGACMPEEGERCGIVTYHSLGKKAGELPVYYIRKAVIHSELGDITRRDMLVAVTNDKLSESGKYHLILHEDYWT